MESTRGELRQLRLMRLALRHFLKGELAYERCKAALRLQLSVLDETCGDWTRGLKEKWNLLELEYTSATNSGSVPAHAIRGIRDSIEAMLAIVDSRIAALH
jgi:hypothetical protein